MPLVPLREQCSLGGLAIQFQVQFQGRDGVGECHDQLDARLCRLDDQGKTEQVPETATSVQKPASEGDRSANKDTRRTDMRIALSYTCHENRKEDVEEERRTGRRASCAAGKRRTGSQSRLPSMMLTIARSSRPDKSPLYWKCDPRRVQDCRSG